MDVLFWLLLVVAALIDARERRFPNALALACALCSALSVWIDGGPLRLAQHAAIALVWGGMLLLLEVAWRGRHGSAGLGLGDLKALVSLAMFDPLSAMLGFALALLLLAATCLLMHRRSLPLLPFLVPSFAVFVYVLG